jgi:hypothetical protein
MDTREVDLGGGSKAKIRRPGFFTMYQWFELGEKMPSPETIKEQVYAEKGKDPDVAKAEETKAVAQAAEGRPKRLTAEEIAFCQNVLIPDAVVEYEIKGKKKQAHDVYLPDLGMQAFSHLLSSIFSFVNEAEAAFRNEDKAA